MQLIIYDNACQMLAQARSIDEVKEIANRAEAARAYAKQAQNRQLEIDALEIRIRAERRLGEIIIALKAEGIGVSGRRASTDGPSKWSDRAFVTLKDLGVDSNVSSIAQRLAALPPHRFDDELAAWRQSAPSALRLETPLQRYRVPSIRGERQKAAARLGRETVQAHDPFDKFKAPDGRRIADWRVGELERLRDQAARFLRCVEALLNHAPVVNDPLVTMEMAFTTAELRDLLTDAWGTLARGDAGLERQRAEASLANRSRTCQYIGCGAQFVMKRLYGKPGEGRFCSRSCASNAKRHHGASAATKAADHGSATTH